MARPSKDLFLQFQEHLNNEQEVREVSLNHTYYNWNRQKPLYFALWILLRLELCQLLIASY